jgi:hypothetical protein
MYTAQNKNDCVMLGVVQNISVLYGTPTYTLTSFYVCVCVCMCMWNSCFYIVCNTALCAFVSFQVCKLLFTLVPQT